MVFDSITNTFSLGTLYPLRVGGTQVTSTEHSGEGWSYDYNTKTLTLNGYNYNGKSCGVSYDGNESLTIVLNGYSYYGEENGINSRGGALNIVLTGSNTIITKENFAGIFVESPLIFSGSGSLSIECSNISSCIVNTNGDITIESGTVIAQGRDGLASANGDAIIKGGNITLTGAVNGIIGNNVTISGGNVTASGGNIAVSGSVKNAIAGTGWTDTAGTEGKADIAISSGGQSLTYKKVQFPAVEKPAATVTKAPAARTLTYTGSAQALVDAGTAEGGEMQYALGNESGATEAYTTSIPKATEAGTYYVWYKATGDGNHLDSEAKMVKATISASGGKDPGTVVTIEEQEKQILSSKKDADQKNSTFAPLQAGAVKVTKAAITVKWKKVKGATGYIVYGGKCKGAMKKLTALSGTTFKQTKLKKGTYYKYIVVAHDGTNVVSVSKTIYAATSGGKVGNVKTVRLNKKKASIKAGKTVRLKASTTADSKGKKIKKFRAISFESSNPDVATVNKKGTVKGVGKGTCYVYVYAQNGRMAKAKITVK